MKKIFMMLTAIILFTTLSAWTNRGSSELKLRFWNNSVFSVVFDNHIVYSPAHKFKATNLKPGKHYIRVIRHWRSPYSPYVHRRTVYRGFINLPASSRVIAKVNRFNDIEIVRVLRYY